MVCEKGSMANTIPYLTIIWSSLGVDSYRVKTLNIILVFWLAPNPGWIKVNTDDYALWYHGKASCGHLFCTLKGFVKGWVWFPISLDFAFEVELLDVIKAMTHIASFDWNCIWIESDLMIVVNAL